MKRRLLSLILCGLMLLGGCGRQAVQEEIWELEEKNVATFSDGETVDRWRGYFENGLQEPWSVYELADGTVLLTEDDVVSVESDTAGYGSLTEEVQAAVSAWYQGEGKYYDLSALLSASYTRWQEQGESFVPGRVGQSTASTATSGSVIYFTTTVEQAVDPENGQQLRYSAAFDRATGQRLDLWTLFTVPEADARMALAAAAGDDPAVQETLAAAIDPVHVIFFEDRLEVEFPAGSLEGLDTAYILVVDYAQLDGVLTSNALPGGAERS